MTTFAVSAADGFFEQVKVRLFAACAEQYTPQLPHSATDAGAGETMTRLLAVTPETVADC